METIKIGAFAYAYTKKIIECAMQDMEEVQKVIDFNADNNFEYEITTDDLGSNGSLINSRCLAKFIENGYELSTNEGKIYLKYREMN